MNTDDALYVVSKLLKVIFTTLKGIQSMAVTIIVPLLLQIMLT